MLKPFDIRDHLDKLEPNEKEKGKYLCPVCGGNDLAINAKNGAYNCFSSGCKPRDIRNLIAPLAKGERPPKTEKRRNADAARKAAEVENKATNLVMLITLGEITLEQAQVELSAWCQEHHHDRYTAGQLLRAKAKNSVSVSKCDTDTDTATDALKPSNSKDFRAVSAKSVNSNGLLSEDDQEEPLTTDREWAILSQMRSSPGSFDPFLWLPEKLAKMARSDAARNSIDPMAIWAYLFPATLSMMGRDTWLDMSGYRVPNIAWSLLVSDSGTGKSRAKNLVMRPIEKWNIEEFENWKRRVEDWQAKEKAKAKDKSDDVRPEPKPKCRRWMVAQSTPEGVVKRLADQENNGLIWVRDEVAGLFKGLTQYSKDSDGPEMLLESWDGGAIMVDRADEDRSFAVESSRMSLAGGIQLKIFANNFETKEDANGMLGRCLCVVPARIPYKRYKGTSVLPAELSKVYKFIDSVNWDTITPTEDADDLFTEVAENFLNQTAPARNVEPWLLKLPGHTLRIAMAIHAIECYYDRSKATSTLTADTLARAYHMAQHYQRHFYYLMGASASDGVEGILAKIQDVACGNDEGVSARDIARGAAGSRVEKIARMEGMKPPAFCLKLFQELASKGWGEIRKTTASNGKTVVKYHAFPDHCPKTTDTADTAPQSLEHQGLRTPDTVSTLPDTVTDTAQDYSLKDTRRKGFEDFNGSLQVTDTVSPPSLETTDEDDDEEIIWEE